jgi:hypothetical protein
MTNLDGPELHLRFIPSSSSPWFQRAMPNPIQYVVSSNGARVPSGRFVAGLLQVYCWRAKLHSRVLYEDAGSGSIFRDQLRNPFLRSSFSFV